MYKTQVCYGHISVGKMAGLFPCTYSHLLKAP